jgi:hypothetical protein
MIMTYTEKYMDLMNKFLEYVSKKDDIKFPHYSNLVFFDASDIKFSKKSLNMLISLKNKSKEVFEITYTGDKKLLWKISRSFDAN